MKTVSYFCATCKLVNTTQIADNLRICSAVCPLCVPATKYRAQQSLYCDGSLSFHEYYLWLARFIGIDKLPECNAEYFASCERYRHLWDNHHNKIDDLARAKRIPWSLSNTICSLKGLAMDL